MKYDIDFVKSNITNVMRKDAKRLLTHNYFNHAILEGLVKYLIHKEYTVMDGEAHIDIYKVELEHYIQE